MLSPVVASPNADNLAPIGTPRDEPRTALHELALRDLGAPEAAAYARVPVAAQVSLLMTTGGRATPASPDDHTWAYVLAGDDAWGWVPADELSGGAWTDTLGLDIPDPYTLRLVAAAPTPWLVSLAADRALRPTPIEAVSRSPRHWTDPARFVTAGPLALVDWRERDRIELVRARDDVQLRSHDDLRDGRPGRRDELLLHRRLRRDPRATRSRRRTCPRSTARCAAGRTPTTACRRASACTSCGSTRKSSRTVILRRALALAIDRTQIPRFMHGGEVPTASFTPGTPIATLLDAQLAACNLTRDTPGVALVMAPELCYVPPPGLAFDPDAAAREVAAAKAELGALPTLRYRYNAGEGHELIAEYLQAAWAAIGVDVELQAQEWNSLLADTRSGDFEIARFGASGTTPDTESDFLPLFRCDSPDHRGRYCNPAFERAMDAARPLVDRRARNAQLRDAEALVLADAPAIPIYVYTQKHLIEPYVHDYADNLVDQPPARPARDG